MSSDHPGTAGLLLAKLVCCGGPLLVIAVASGALSLLGAGVVLIALAGVVAAVAFIATSRERACSVDDPRRTSVERTGAAHDLHTPGRRRMKISPDGSGTRDIGHADHDLPSARGRGRG